MNKRVMLFAGAMLGVCAISSGSSAQSYIIRTPGSAPTYANPTPGGGYVMTSPGSQPTYVNPTPGGGYVATSPGSAPSYITPGPGTRSYTPPSLFGQF